LLVDHPACETKPQAQHSRQTHRTDKPICIAIAIASARGMMRAYMYKERDTWTAKDVEVDVLVEVHARKRHLDNATTTVRTDDRTDV